MPRGAGQVGEISQDIQECRHDCLLRMDGDHCRNERSFCVFGHILIFSSIELRLEPHGLIAQLSMSLDLSHEMPFDHLWRLSAHQPYERPEDELGVGQWLPVYRNSVRLRTSCWFIRLIIGADTYYS